MSDGERDYYEVLGIPRDADAKAVKQAYHRLAMKWHPDRNRSPEAEERFKEIAKAYAILSDPVYVPYACMGTEALADGVAEGLDRGVCVLMENHGVLTVGRTLLEAFDRLEVLEVAAKHTLLVGHQGPISSQLGDYQIHILSEGDCCLAD